MKVAIVDYGMGNIKSIISALKYLNVEEIVLSNKFNDIKSADKLILPGVGSFSKAMKNIKQLNLDKILYQVVVKERKPILGICLGMQLMCQGSDEDEGSEGLKYIDASCKRFDIGNLKVPHIGFNQVRSNMNSKLYDGLSKKNDFYFIHSFRVQSNKNINQSNCHYGEDFIASYEVDNMLGVQFHPELSQTNGIKVLKNFLEKF